MKILFKNALILTVDDKYIKDGEHQLIKDGVLIVDNDKISYVGDDKTKIGDEKTYDRIIDANSNIVMPGFVNAHTHSAMTFVRSYCDNNPLYKWLSENIWPLEAKLTDEDVYWFTKLAILEYLSSGTTSIIDMYGHIPAVLDACIDMGFRASMIDPVMAKDTNLYTWEDTYHKINENKKDVDKLTRYYFALHAEYTNTPELIKAISDLVHKYKTPFGAHNSETFNEVEECKTRWKGLTPTEVFEEYDLFAYGGNQDHCIYLSDHDIEIFKKHNITVVANASSNMKLASGIADYKKYIGKGLKIAIGTDGPSSNNSLDMFKEMFLVCNTQKVLHKDVMAMNPHDVITMATKNGCAAMMNNDYGVLREGNKADIIMLDIHMPNMQPLNDIVNNIVYAGQTKNVKLTMVNGKILYEDGIYHISDKVEEIYDKCQKLTDDVKQR